MPRRVLSEMLPTGRGNPLHLWEHIQMATPLCNSACAREIASQTSRSSVQLRTRLNPGVMGLDREKTTINSLSPFDEFRGFLFTNEIMNASCKVWGEVSCLKVIENMFCSHSQTLCQIAFFSD